MKTHNTNGLPGDLSPQEKVKRMIRVNHAGELGAVRIYQGQLAVLKRKPAAALLEHMYAQEKRHLETFQTLLEDRGIDRTLFHPVWYFSGYALGFLSALLGPASAMACTVAIEEVIDEHYAQQAQDLEKLPDEQALKEVVERFRQEEAQHCSIALDAGAPDAPGFKVMACALKKASRLAIWLSERV